MKLRKKFLIFILALLFCQIPITVYATNNDSGIENDVNDENNSRFTNSSPWLKDTSDESIYSNSIDAAEENQDISVKNPGRVEKYIAELFRNIGSSIISILQDNIGASLDSIVFGRVGSGQPDKVNIFSFELRKGNPYGVTGAVCYALLRGMMFIFLGVTFVFQLAKAAWSGQTAKSREEIKAIMPSMIVKFAALMLMPYLLDVALYVRDVLLFGIKEVTGQMISGGASLSLSKSFLLNAERSGTFVDAIMYLGTVILTIYFVFLYVAVAIDTLICFISFPFLCVLQSKKRDLMGNWTMTVFSNMITPIIDAVLLLIPLLTSIMLSDTIKGVAIIQLIMCMLIIPARGRFKAFLGVQSNDRNGFLGAMGAMALSKAIAGRIKQGIGKLTDAYSDAKKSRMYGEMADVDQEEESAYLSGNGDASKGKDYEDSQISQEANEHTEDDDNEGDNPLPGDTLEDIPEDTPEGADDIPNDILEDPEYVPNELQNTPEDLSAFEENSKNTAAENINSETAESATRADKLRDFESTESQAQAEIDKLKVKKAGLQQEDKQLKRQMLNYDRGSNEYKELEKAKADIEERTAAIDGKIAMEGQRANQARKSSKELRESMGVHSTPTNFDEKRAEILQKRANISNFESPDFSGVLSNEQMKNLYQKRAVANVVKFATGTGAAALGGTALGGAAVFMGPSSMSMAASGGMYAGGVVGENAVEVALEAKRAVTPAAKYIGNSVSRAANAAATAYLLDKIKPAVMQVDPGWPEEQVIPEDQPGNTPASGTNDENKMRQEKIKTEVSYVLSQILDSEANIKKSSILIALQEANMEVERSIAIMKEEKNVAITEEIIRNKRISAQTDALSYEIMHRMKTIPNDDKTADIYKEAKEMIQERVRRILEEKDQPLT